MTQLEPMNYERFFMQVLPRRLTRETGRFLAARGSISISIGDDVGYSITLGARAAPVRVGFDEDADLKLWLSHRAFDDMMVGQLAVDAAIAQGDIFASGRLGLLEELAHILNPPVVAGGSSGWMM